MRSQLNRRKDSRRTVGTTDNSQRSRFFRRESHQNSNQQNCEDTQLSCRPEDRKPQIAQHRTKVGQCSNAHKDNRRQEASLDQHIINEVHQSQFMRNVMQRHLPNILHHTMYFYHSVFICLNNAHLASWEIGQQDTESNRDQQQRFILLLDTQIKQDECNGIHDQELRFSNDIAERSHFI